MEIRKLQPEEYKAAEMLESLSFVYPVSNEKEEKDAYQADRWGVFDESGRLTATLTNHDLPVFLDGGTVPARGVGGVASDPVSRGQGYIRALMEAVLKDDRKNGQLFSALYPFSHPFYRKFGYEICFETHMAKFLSKALKEFRTDDPPQARIIQDGPEPLFPIYTAFARQYNLAVARDARIWKRLKISDPKKAEKYCYVLSRGGRDTAYVIFNFRSEEKPYLRTLCLTDYAFLDVRGFHDLMGFLYRYTAQARNVELAVPDSLPLTSLLPEAYDVENFGATRPMARAVHVEHVLKAMRHPEGNGAYSVYVEDDFLPENTGCYAVRYTKDGGIDVVRSESEADLRVSVQTFTQLALGFIGLDEAAYKSDVRIFCNETTLQQVFIRKPVFLWDFY